MIGSFSGLRQFALIGILALTAGCAQQPVHHDSVAKRGVEVSARAPENATGNKKQSRKSRSSTATALSPQDEPQSEDQLWWSLGENLSFANDIPDHRISRQLSWLEGNQKFFDNTLSGAEIFLPYVLDRVLEANLPSEAALLPFIESAYDPSAVSPNGAAGLWQFIPSTGKHFGLEETRWYEGRMDIVASTDAAISYLASLNTLFDGDWLLTFAAYNSGPGTVRRAIEKNKRQGLGTDFWSLDLPPTTQRYVPKLIALSKVISEPENFQVELKPLSSEIPFSVIEPERPVSLASVAEIIDISPDEIKTLNPGYASWSMPTIKPHYLLLPNEMANNIEQKLEELADAAPLTREYVVKKGDTLSGIAQRSGMSASELAAANNLELTGILRIGQRLRLSPDIATTSADNGKLVYHVSSGDSLWSIAKKHRVQVDELMAWNRLSSHLLKPGQELTIYR